MTTAHVEKFAELVAKDPALLAKLGLDKVNADAAAAAASAAAFITNAVTEAKALGLQFTEEEFHAFMDAEAKAAASGELSDTHLDAVAGGFGEIHTLDPFAPRSRVPADHKDTTAGTSDAEAKAILMARGIHPSQQPEYKGTSHWADWLGQNKC